MKRPVYIDRPFYADADQQDEPVPDVPLLAALVAFAWSKRVWIGIVIAGALFVLAVVWGASLL